MIQKNKIDDIGKLIRLPSFPNKCTLYPNVLDYFPSILYFLDSLAYINSRIHLMKSSLFGYIKNHFYFTNGTFGL